MWSSLLETWIPIFHTSQVFILVEWSLHQPKVRGGRCEVVVGVRKFYVQQYCNEIKCDSNNNTLFFLPVYPSKETITPFSSYLVAQLVWQWNTQESSTSVESTECLVKAIFCFLDLNEINIALREEVPKLYIIMYSNPSLPYIVSITH